MNVGGFYFALLLYFQFLLNKLTIPICQKRKKVTDVFKKSVLKQKLDLHSESEWSSGRKMDLRNRL